MENKKELILLGKLERDYDGNIGIRKKDSWVDGLAEEIGNFIENISNKLSHVYDKEVEENGLGYRICTSEDNIQLRYYISDNEINSKEEIEEKYLEKILGSIDIALENIGYSEYTITGYDLVNFKLGGHDLEKIFSNYLGKYACIIVNKEDIKE